jgi:hypothetical protein
LSMPDGTQRTGPVPVVASAAAGTVLRGWVDASGRLTAMPLQYRQVERQAALAAVIAAAGLGAVLLAVAALARRHWITVGCPPGIMPGRKPAPVDHPALTDVLPCRATIRGRVGPEFVHYIA